MCERVGQFSESAMNLLNSDVAVWRRTFVWFVLLAVPLSFACLQVIVDRNSQHNGRYIAATLAHQHAHKACI